MKMMLVLGVLLWGTACVQSKQAVRKTATTNSTSSVQRSGIKSYGAGAIGSNTDSVIPKVVVPTDNVIEFSSTNGVLKRCTYPSGNCRTNQDEHSGGATASEAMPGTEKSFLHYMKFRFYSNGYFSKNPEGHFAFGLRGKRMRVEDYGDKAGVDGRGMIIGAIGYGYFYNKNNRACVDRMAQIESFYRSSQIAKKAEFGNKIFPETCSDTIFEDNKWYSVELEATAHQYIIYKIFNNEGKLIYKSYLYDQPNYLDPNLTEWFIGHVFNKENTTWSVRLENFEVGHIVDGDVFYPVKNFSSPLSFSVDNKPISTEKSRDYSVVITKGASNQIKLNNVVNRTRLYGCASFRKTKTSVDSVDCQNPENYRMMTFSTETDWRLAGENYILRETFADNYPAQFYTLYFRLNPQDELTEAALSFELKEKNSAANAGTFCDANSKTLTKWSCGPKPSGSWVDVGGGCFHQETNTACQ